MLNRLEMLRIFCVAADTGSFRAAATRLGISPQAVTRAIKELERLQGETLFHRSTRSVQITAFGANLASQARTRLAQLDDLFKVDALDDSTVAGLVRIAAPVALGRQLLLPVLLSLAHQHPQLRFDLRLSDQRADVVDEHIDIGIRAGHLRDNRFVARSIRPVQFHVVATPPLIARVGVPTHIESLHQLPTTALFDRDSGKPWPWFFADGQTVTIDAPRVLCDDADAELQAIMSGLGFGQVPDFLVAQALRLGVLQEVLEQQRPEPWLLYVYRPQRGPVPARIRVVFDALVLALSEASTAAANA